MRHTKNETEVHTLTRLITAMDNHHPVTITYLKEETRDVIAVNSKGIATRRTIRTGRLVETVRTVELYDVTISQAGDILIKAMDRSDGKAKSFRLDRIRAYTVHRTSYVVPRDTTTEDTHTTPRPSLAGFTLHPLDLDTDPVDQLTDYLTAA